VHLDVLIAILRGGAPQSECFVLGSRHQHTPMVRIRRAAHVCVWDDSAARSGNRPNEHLAAGRATYCAFPPGRTMTDVNGNGKFGLNREESW
jgi:hypothetical protein